MNTANNTNPEQNDEPNTPEEQPGEDPGLEPEPLDSYQEPPAPPQEEAPATDEVQARIAALEAELARSKDQTLRALAEADNTRKRAVRDREDAGRYAVTAFARDLLDVADNFRRAIESITPELREIDERIAGLIAGIEAVENEMLKAFEKHGIRKLDPIDELFNPNYHEVMFEAPVPGKNPGTVIQVIEPGYIINDRLLRPARVGVAKDTEGNTSEDGHQLDTEA